MKKLTIILLSAIVCMLVIGCKSQEVETTVDDSDEEYLINYLQSEDAFQKAIQKMEDGNPAQILEFTGKGRNLTIEDLDLIQATWDSLIQSKINVASGDDGYVSEDSPIVFRFIWDDGEEYTLSFYDYDYFVKDDGKVYQISQFSPVVDVVEKIMAFDENVDIANAYPDDWEEGEFSFAWDLDLDGEKERFMFEYHDNGDEAPSVYEIEMNQGEQVVYLDRAYGIYLLKPVEVNGERYVEIHYEQGDYYSHDIEAICYLKMVGKELTIEYGEE